MSSPPPWAGVARQLEQIVSGGERELHHLAQRGARRHPPMIAGGDCAFRPNKIDPDRARRGGNPRCSNRNPQLHQPGMGVIRSALLFGGEDQALPRPQAATPRPPAFPV